MITENGRLVVVSDIHSNWHALEAVIADLPRDSSVVCLGDIVGYGADAKRCLDAVRQLEWTTLLGNHDHACFEPDAGAWFNRSAREAIAQNRAQLDAADIQWLRERPLKLEVDGAIFCHGSPRDPLEEYLLSEFEAGQNAEMLGWRTCFHGHTHLPGVLERSDDRWPHSYQLGEMRMPRPGFVNPGSVGQPRDGDPRASYVIVDLAKRSLEFRRVEYDVAGAQRAIWAAGLPARLAERLMAGI